MAADQRIPAAETDARCLELRRAGLSYRQIAGQVGLSVANVHGRVMRGLDRTRREPADALRELELDRLDVLQVALTRVLGREHVTISGGKVVLDEHGRPYRDDGPTVSAAQALVRVQESRRRLLGVDAPAQVDLKVLTMDQMTARIGELSALLAADDPDWDVQDRRRRDREQALERFRAAWSTRPPAGWRPTRPGSSGTAWRCCWKASTSTPPSGRRPPTWSSRSCS